MSYIDERLPTCVAYGFSGGPEWNTRLVLMDNGREQRNAQWMYPRHRFSAQYMNLLTDAQQTVLRFFHAMRGRLHCFRFKDANDFQSVAEPQAPTIGATNPLQIVKTYTVGSASSVRLIQAIVEGTATVYRDGVPVVGTWDYGTGRFTPAAAWVAGEYTADFEFDLWVRFDSDFNAFTIGNRSNGEYVHTADIELIEVRR